MSAEANAELLKKKIGENIKSIRQRLQIEVKKLCTDLDIAPSTYSNIERGVTDINISRLMQLAEYFSVHYSQILALDNTNVFYFSPQSQENSTQHNINHQGNNSSSEVYEDMIELAKQELSFLKDQNTKLLEIIASK